MKNNCRLVNRRAFTLIELLLVMSILIMIAGAGFVGINKARQSANIKNARIIADQAKEAVNSYYSVMNEWPGEDVGLTALIEKPTDTDEAEKWSELGPYIIGGKIPTDAWGQPLNYALVDEDDAAETGIYFHVYSSGPNKIDDKGTGDDIPAWAEDK